jgi:hypothetical protein
LIERSTPSNGFLTWPVRKDLFAAGKMTCRPAGAKHRPGAAQVKNRPVRAKNFDFSPNTSWAAT